MRSPEPPRRGDYTQAPRTEAPHYPTPPDGRVRPGVPGPPEYPSPADYPGPSDYPSAPGYPPRPGSVPRPASPPAAYQGDPRQGDPYRGDPRQADPRLGDYDDAGDQTAEFDRIPPPGDVPHGLSLADEIAASRRGGAPAGPTSQPYEPAIAEPGPVAASWATDSGPQAGYDGPPQAGYGQPPPAEFDPGHDPDARWPEGEPAPEAAEPAVVRARGEVPVRGPDAPRRAGGPGRWSWVPTETRAFKLAVAVALVVILGGGAFWWMASGDDPITPAAETTQAAADGDPLPPVAEPAPADVVKPAVDSFFTSVTTGAWDAAAQSVCKLEQDRGRTAAYYSGYFTGWGAGTTWTIVNTESAPAGIQGTVVVLNVTAPAGDQQEREYVFVDEGGWRFCGSPLA